MGGAASPSSIILIDPTDSGGFEPPPALVGGVGGGPGAGSPIERPNRFTPYSFRECWQKEPVAPNETKRQFYWRRFCEILLMIVACCIRCIGPV